MSEEILKALMQLFAIISKQDEGTRDSQREFVKSFLISQLNKEKVQEYFSLFDEKAGITKNKKGEPSQGKGIKLTAMKDSVRTLSICMKINKTLTRKQKVIVLIRLFELLKVDKQYTDQRMGIINTVASTFKISSEELELISSFSRNDDPYIHDSEEIIVCNSSDRENVNILAEKVKHVYTEGLNGNISIIRIKSVDLYFIKYKGENEIFLNGLLFNVNNIYLLAPGSNVRVPKGTIYYSDVISRFLRDEKMVDLSFNASKVSYKFPNGAIGIRNINISEKSGLTGLMGVSGAGKTTLLNVLSGIENPSEGSVTINGIDIHKNPENAEGIIGYISQDDLLMENLTVFENLYYNAKLCFKNLKGEEIKNLVEKVLKNFGLYEIRNIKVGNPLNKKISGGQRKRLNISLELIREPSVLFVDEPTSGLSSTDSENVMDLLKELSLKGKLIFVVIHQPSSDIYKMFDKIFILDVGGYPIYYGNPIEAVMYFKRVTNQINADVGECFTCGNVNPELLLNIIESKIVDDFGHYTDKRLKTPADWNELYESNVNFKTHKDVREIPSRTFQIPGKFKQMGIFVKRDILSKISNLQYMIINLFEAPLLSFVLVFIIKYRSGTGDTYIFRGNENIPPYIFMCIIVALFIGLTVSAEEIFCDQKILKRESFLNLSRSSYLLSKVSILTVLSAIQTISFVLVGNFFLEIKGLYFDYWLVLFSVSCFANLLGLNISASFNSAVTIYILIPLLVIPQMILGGAMFSFDKLNEAIGGDKRKAPVIADIMASRWAYEALSVTQFIKNEYEKKFYKVDKIKSMANYKLTYYIPELQQIFMETKELLENDSDSAKNILKQNIALLKNEITSENSRFNDIQFQQMDKLHIDKFDEEILNTASGFIDDLNDKYIQLYNAISKKKDNMINQMQTALGGKAEYNKLYDDYYNDFLADLTKKTLSKDKIIRQKDELIRIMDPIFLDPSANSFFSFRTHFYAPVKYFFGKKMDSLYFNIIIIWLSSLLLYITLYYNVLKKSLDFSGNIKYRKNGKKYFPRKSDKFNHLDKVS